ncbi:glyoxylase-like metal-dependent hydrolase (beta-lactamase superfamily II) [Nocardioides perillae]|uniref:Glyoxylase-like metal-dependent hydrolase (Beta-lactamase superfamily II) n=1 Tax=Nocardioides perillae TaxID=1119534 RepID=A0A7Y9RPB0_9ACTN|nr:glyoxylase-like metal-dependent hydrolase (beta-lactamase superfamily II) [Nocardioides perillae]
MSADSGLLWTEPGAWPVAEGVHRIPLPLPMDGLRAVNVYVLETEEGLTLVDGGWAIPESRTLLESCLRSIGHDLRDVTRFLVTHVHRDHYTQAVTVRRDLGLARVSLGLGDKPTLDLVRAAAEGGLSEDPAAAQLRAAGAHDLARAWGMVLGDEEPDEALFSYPDDWLDGDHTVAVGSRTIDAVATPGHTQGHFVFADRAAGLLFAGDHVLPHITPSIGFEPVPAELPLGDYLASLTKVRGLPDARLLPAHGPVVASAHARVDELLAHHEERLARCAAAVRGGAATALEVARVLPWTSRDTAYADLGVFDSALAVMETQAHLRLLVARGEATAETDAEGAVGYALVPAAG